MLKNEKESITKIVNAGLIFNRIFMDALDKCPESMAITMVASSFAGLMRDLRDFAIENNSPNPLIILAKYWQISYIGADPIKDGATPKQIEAVKIFKAKVDKILEDCEEEIIWEGFDKI